MQFGHRAFDNQERSRRNGRSRPSGMKVASDLCAEGGCRESVSCWSESSFESSLSECSSSPQRRVRCGGLWDFIFSRAGAIGDLTILDTLTIKAIMTIIAKGQVGLWRVRASPKLTCSCQPQALIHLCLSGPIKDWA